jgi:F-type H+-transporting ATPase subunit gamma
MGDRPSITDITPITRLIIDGFTNQEVDAVHIVYARFVNTTVQRPVIEQLLPVVPPSEESPSAGEYIYEPNSMTVLSAMLPRFVEMQLYHAVLEGIASEQSARMVAMRNATDNANAMTDDLTLEMNKVRQEAITTELLDIVSGAAAVEA